MYTSRVRWVACLVLAIAAIASSEAAADSARPIVVDSSNALENALVDANAGRRIVVKSGTYSVTHTLTVPDGATLQGEGVMTGDPLPAGFTPETVTRIVAIAGFSGDILRLGNGASLRNLSVEDVPRDPGSDHSGNVIGVVSRSAGDVLSASIVDCEIVNPNPFEPPVGDGPTAGGIVAVTRNPRFGEDPPPHVGAVVSLQVTHSIVRAAFRALVAMNFASDGRVNVALSNNVVAGTLEATGGVARPDPVHNAATTIDSAANLYAPPAESQGRGWQIGGGSSVPLPFPTFGATSNHVRVSSTDDRIEAATTGIYAFAGRRFSDKDEPSSDNTVELRLRDLAIRTGEGAADLVLHAAESGGEFSPGDRNTISVDMADSSGSGQRANEYLNVWGPQYPENWGDGNRLQFVGTLAAFTTSNTNILPPPPAEFFTD